MIRIGGEPLGEPGTDTEFCGLVYPDGDEISKHMAQRLRSEPFYQADKLDQALALIKNRRVAIDCGAWVGGWSRELARHFKSVVAIEAHPSNARCVTKNLAGFQHASTLNIAVGDRRDAVRVRTLPNGPNVSTHVDDAGEHEMEMWPLDDLLRAFEVVDYIKIHVNGMELAAMRGAAATIKKHRPILTVVLKPWIEDYGTTAEAARHFLTDTLAYQPFGGERPYEIWGPR